MPPKGAWNCNRRPLQAWRPWATDVTRRAHDGAVADLGARDRVGGSRVRALGSCAAVVLGKNPDKAVPPEPADASPVTCDPPYTLDAQGRKTWKRNCFE